MGGDQNLAAKPLSCQVSVTCQMADGSRVEPQTFDFPSTTETYADMRPTTVDKFTDCQTVVFNVHSTALGVGGTVDQAFSAFIDTVLFSTR